MERTPILLVAAAAFVGGAAGLALVQHLRDDAPAPAARAPAEAAGPKVLYWYDPMHPDKHFDQPGKSPFMDMQLVPKYASESTSGAGSVTIDPRLVQSLGVRTAAATVGRLERTVRATGAIAFDERAVTQVSAPVAAIVERLHVRAPLDPVGAGTPLVTLLAPEWTAAQEEYLALRRGRAPGLEGVRAAARQRLLLLGMTEDRIRALESRGRADPRVVVAAPRAGVIGELAVREGAAVMAGTPLVRINGLERVWINAAVPERDAGSVGTGTTVRATVPAYPGESFDGVVEALLPSLDPATRTVTARVVLDNTGGRLLPGMFAQLELSGSDAAREHVLVPTEAVIATGTRHVVVVAESAGRFRAQEVRVGAEHGGRTEILDGLDHGARVVLSGQFLIDSEASLSGALRRLEGPAASGAPPHGEHGDANGGGERR